MSKSLDCTCDSWQSKLSCITVHDVQEFLELAQTALDRHREQQ